MFSANSSQVSDDKLFVEDVFSTYLFNGQGGSTNYNVINGIDLAGKGGLVWSKYRTTTASNWFIDTARGALQAIAANTTDAEFTAFQNMTTGFLSNGFTFKDGNAGFPLTSWTFRKAPKFFDVVTYTGNGASNRSISHALGVAPGVMIIKRYDSTGQWVTYHRSLGNGNALVLESTSAQFATNTFGYTTPDATTFTVNDYNNINGATYVAYLFAHDATSDGIIQCGSYTGNGSATGPTVTLGWEPQWVLVKNATTGYDWWMLDTMRGFTVPSSNDAYLVPNSSQVEAATQDIMTPTATGFQLATSGPMFNRSGDTFIYIAIRRGPMRTPTSGTSVFAPVARTGTGATATVSAGFAPDVVIIRERSVSGTEPGWYDKLRGPTRQLRSNLTSSEVTNSSTQEVTSFLNNGFSLAASDNLVSTNSSGFPYINYNFRRAPSFFDEVCYTGTGNGVVQSVKHNLGIAPEMVIMKERTTAFYSWIVWHTALDLSSTYGLLALNNSAGVPAFSSNNFNSTIPTSTAVSVTADGNASGRNYVLYLFASCPGVSKVGSYTGNGSSQTINCGFSGGARFVMIKRKDATGDWYVWDTARGIVSGNDPHLSLNTTAAEVTTDDTIDTDSSGFVVNQVSATNVNVSSATYIYLAVA